MGKVVKPDRALMRLWVFNATKPLGEDEARACFYLEVEVGLVTRLMALISPIT